MPFQLRGPKGGLLVRHAKAAALPRIVTTYVRRFGKVTVTRAPDHPDEKTRAAIVDYCRWGIQHEPEIHYAETRPIPLRAGKARQLPLTTDCSGFATIAYYQAGAPNPNGGGYTGEGYTGTLLRHGRTVPLVHARPGDLVVFGPGSGHHVAVVMENDGRDPVLCSHGQELGPARIRFSVEQRYQPHPATFLSYL